MRFTHPVCASAFSPVKWDDNTHYTVMLSCYRDSIYTESNSYSACPIGSTYPLARQIVDQGSSSDLQLSESFDKSLDHTICVDHL